MDVGGLGDRAGVRGDGAGGEDMVPSHHPLVSEVHLGEARSLRRAISLDAGEDVPMGWRLFKRES